MERLKNFWQNAKRVIKLSRKPTLKEFRMIARICALGVVVIGFIGYAIQMMFQFLIIPFFNSMPSRSLIEIIEIIIKLIFI
ncbi:MAG: protein translocase SEC61 complex subunit gamma [Candidatus Helarchaeota archaeon]